MKSLLACMLSVVLVSLLAGCESESKAAPEPIADATVDLSQLFSMRRAGSADSDPSAVPTHLNAPRAAAQEIATRAQPIDRSTDRMVRLHAAMYRAAINADEASHSAYLLNPVDDPAAPLPSAISTREFRLRVLATLTGVSAKTAWDAPELTWMFDQRAPGGPAALAWFEVVGENPELATIEADVCIESPRTGTRKYRVEAIYDGQRWIVRDLGSRTVW